tara:strand:+ start:1001 stop:1648 length:648 start_codon:yes stop_codon:yes gene_type:complete
MAETKLIPQENKDPNSTDVEYKPINATVVKKVQKESGWTGFTFAELADDKICGIAPTMAKKISPVLNSIVEGSLVQVNLVDSGDFRNISRIELVDSGGDGVNSQQSTQETIPQVNVVSTKPIQKVPAAWESGVDYNDRKDNKICLNVAAAEAVKLYGHVANLTATGFDTEINGSFIATKLNETYNLATGIIEKLANLSEPVESDDESGYESDIAS